MFQWSRNDINIGGAKSKGVQCGTAPPKNLSNKLFMRGVVACFYDFGVKSQLFVISHKLACHILLLAIVWKVTKNLISNHVLQT